MGLRLPSAAPTPAHSWEKENLGNLIRVEGLQARHCLRGYLGLVIKAPCLSHRGESQAPGARSATGLGSELALGLGHSGRWQEEVRNHSWGRAPQSCLCFLPAR